MFTFRHVDRYFGFVVKSCLSRPIAVQTVVSSFHKITTTLISVESPNFKALSSGLGRIDFPWAITKPHFGHPVHRNHRGDLSAAVPEPRSTVLQSLPLSLLLSLLSRNHAQSSQSIRFRRQPCSRWIRSAPARPLTYYLSNIDQPFSLSHVNDRG